MPSAAKHALAAKVTLVVDRYRLGKGTPLLVAATRGAVWVLMAVGPRADMSAPIGEGRVAVRVDPATGKVLARVRLSDGATDLAASPGAAWVGVETTTSLLVDRIDARTAKVTTAGSVPGDGANHYEQVVATDGAVWVIEGEGVVRINPATRQVVARVAMPGDPSVIVATPGGLWALTGVEVGTEPHSAVVGIDGSTNAVTKMVAVPGGGTAGMTYADGSLWVQNGGLARVDLRTGRLTQSAISLRSPFAQSLAQLRASGTHLWELNSLISSTFGRMDAALVDLAGTPRVSRRFQMAGAYQAATAAPSGLWIATRTDLVRVRPA
ncbi:MAG: hypothetical protein J2P57_18050 [Acidimicrobiaceae bacterium]|nr:hypothetical protein [Acidimicrobiaceae bacterium]